MEKAFKKYLCGSNYFFGKFKDYVWHDYDIIIVRENAPKIVDYQRLIDEKKNIDYFIWKKNTPEWHVNHLLNEVRFQLDIGHLLIPEVNKELGITIEHLKQLKDIANELVGQFDGLYDYYKIIYDAYITNNDFILTDEQRLAAYNEYKKARRDRYK